MEQVSVLRESDYIDDVVFDKQIDYDQKVKKLELCVSTYEDLLKKCRSSLEKLAKERNGPLDRQNELKERLQALRKRARVKRWKKCVTVAGCTLGMFAMGILGVLVALGTLGVGFLSFLGLSAPIIATFKLLSDFMDVDETKIMNDIRDVKKEIDDTEDLVKRIAAKIDLEEHNEEAYKSMISYCRTHMSAIQLSKVMNEIQLTINERSKEISRSRTRSVTHNRETITQQNFIDGANALTNGFQSFKRDYDTLSQDCKDSKVVEAAEKLVDNVEEVALLTDDTVLNKVKKIKEELNEPLVA